jgi:trimeric autotransporter adhesin
MKKIIYLLLIFAIPDLAFSQISSDQLLRLNNIDSLVHLNAIASPQAGQLAFVVSDSTTYHYDGELWVTFTTDTLSLIMDEDEDTWVRVDNGSDNDVIDFAIQGTHHFRLTRGRLDVFNIGHSVFIGEGAGAQNTGNLSTNTGVRNVAVGYQAWGSVAGNDNVAIGYRSMMNNSNSSPFHGSVAVGSQSLQYNRGGENTALGATSLHLNTTGIDNTGCGSSTLYNNKIGSNNSAFGLSALKANTTGSDNSAFGKEALNNNSLGSSNSAFGVRAMTGNTTGNQNSAYGSQALSSNGQGNNNSAFGNQSLRYNTTGYNNSAFGSLSMVNNLTGYGNSSFGHNSLSDNLYGDNNCSFGHSSSLEIFNGENNCAFGYLALRQNQNGHRNCAFGALALTSAKGDNNIGIGSEAQVANAMGNNQVRIGNAGITHAAIQVDWSISSDLHCKENVRNLPYGLNLISKLRPVDYLRKNSPKKGREVGFIAQELVKVLEEVGFDNQGFLTQTDQGHYEVRYNDFIPIAIKGIQEQQQQIEELKANYKRLLERLDDLEQSKN